MCYRRCGFSQHEPSALSTTFLRTAHLDMFMRALSSKGGWTRSNPSFKRMVQGQGRDNCNPLRLNESRVFWPKYYSWIEHDSLGARVLHPPDVHAQATYWVNNPLLAVSPHGLTGHRLYLIRGLCSPFQKTHCLLATAVAFSRFKLLNRTSITLEDKVKSIVVEKCLGVPYWALSTKTSYYMNHQYWADSRRWPLSRQ